MPLTSRTVRSVTDAFHKGLNSFYTKDEISSLLAIAFEHYLGFKKIDLRLKQELELSITMKDELLRVLGRLSTQEPIQYILGKAFFYEMQFKVTPDVLIPRPETEELVQYIVAQAPKNATILDIGTGSGCIAVSLKKNLPGASIFACDISQKAIEVTCHNAKQNKVEIVAKEIDILEVTDLVALFGHQFDVIVSNPPYIPVAQKQEMESNVLDYEPHQALFVEDKAPLIFYEKIATLARQSLKKNGQVFFEINESMGDEIEELLMKKSFQNIGIIKDINQKERIAYAEL